MHELIIIGGGITGQTAAIYAARKRMDFVLIAKELGGQFLESGDVLNYPGIVKTTGAEFSIIMEEQLKFNGITPIEGEEVRNIKKIDGGFRAHCARRSHDGKTLIIATGARARKIGVPGEDRLARKGVTYCSICDGPLFAGKNIAIIGGGNSALEGVNFTKDIAKKIYLITIEKQFRAHEYLIEGVELLKNVEVIHEATTIEILGEDRVSGLRYEKEGRVQELSVEGIIIEIGRTPNTEFVQGFLELIPQGHIRIDCWTRTSIEGVFAAGDCASGQEYQYVIAAGQGCMALIKASRYLANLKGETAG
ncbi:MAG: FAD-dependent oxidoreductase [Candidatus Aureabacteria bacterium]|nr:FAD-dependent oxidoreductase [Candidatus Auribacterota bacterium]